MILNKTQRLGPILILALIFNCQRLTAQPTSSRQNIDQNWKFHFGHATDPAQDFQFKIANSFSKTGKEEGTPAMPKFNDSTWTVLNLPHDWAVSLPFQYKENFDLMAHGYRPVGGLFPENSVGWYRKELSIAAADSGSRIVVTFDGIFRDALVWINGYYLGNHRSGYTGVTYDLTDFVSFGGRNVLVVRVDATQAEGWFYEGAGIYRHVWLEKYHNLHIDRDGGQFVYNEVSGSMAELYVETTISNANLDVANAEVVSYLTDRTGKKLKGASPTTIEVKGNESGTVRQHFSISDPRLWSLEDPYLYRVVSEVRSNGQLVDKQSTRFGIRTVVIDKERGVLLNEKPIKIQGVNCHQDHAGVGSALPDYLQYYRIRLLKEMGANAYRASHNPPTPELLDACDSLGMLVLDETRLLNSTPEYMDQLAWLIRRDRNHPSVFMWSIGNEEGYIQTTSVGKRIALSMLSRQQALDPTRTSTYAADLANVFKGVNTVIPVRGFNYREKGMVPYHLDHPDQPVIGTEMGSTVTTRGVYRTDSITGYLPDQDITHPWWASLAEDWWPIAADNQWLLGGFVWTGFDYRGEPTPFEWPNINSHFGIMDVCGFPKNIYYYYQSWWRPDLDVLHISPHWNWLADESVWDGQPGDPVTVWVNSNADEVELFLNGKSQGKKTMPRNSHLTWVVPYKPGVLKAVGTRDGRRFSTEVATTGDPYQVVLTPDRTTLLADGQDATVVNVTVVDKKGREVPTASNWIHFSLDGEAQILGVGNGDPSSHEADVMEAGRYERSLFNGKCQLILQSGLMADQVSLSATSPGLKEASVTIRTLEKR